MSSDNAQCSSTGVTWNSLEPVVDLAMNNGDFVPELADSHNLVACVAAVPEGAVIAVDPQAALSNGCTKYTGG